MSSDSDLKSSSQLDSIQKSSRLMDKSPSLLRLSHSESRHSVVSFSTDMSHMLESVSMFSETESEEQSESPWDLIVNIDENDLRTRVVVTHLQGILDSNVGLLVLTNILEKNGSPRFKNVRPTEEEYHLSQKQLLILEFVNGAEDKVAVWRPPANKTSKDLEKMPLAVRAAFIEDMVASRFCKWLRGLGGRPPNLDEKSLKELFQIGIVNPTSASIRTVFEERTFIPDLAAEKLNLPQKTLLNQLERHLWWDIVAESQPKKTTAFGKFLEPADQYRPPKNRTRETWLSCDSIPKDMERFTEHAYQKIKSSRPSFTPENARLKIIERYSMNSV